MEAGGSNGWAAISRLHPRQELGAVVPIEKQPPKNYSSSIKIENTITDGVALQVATHSKTFVRIM